MLATIVPLCALLLAGNPMTTEGDRLNTLLEAYWEEYLVLDPVTATAIGDPRYNHRFPDSLSPAGIAERKAFTERWSDALGGIDRAKLVGQDRLSYDILRRDLAEEREGQRFPDELLPIHQFSSVPAFFGQLGSGEGIQPFKTAKDYDDFLKRGDAIVAWMDRSALNMREGIERGIVQPRMVMLKVLPQLETFLVSDPEASIFWRPLKAMPAQIAEADRQRLAGAYRTAIAERWVPAYRRLHAFVRDEYLPRTRETVGLSALPDGAAWYAYRVKASTTTDLDVDTIHELGLSEVARIRGEMEAVRKQVGFEGDLRAFFVHLQEDPRFYYTKEEDLLEGYRELQKRINGLLPKLFDVAPKADYVVKPVEAFRAASDAGASYQPGTPDGSRPGVFYVNTYNLRAQPRFGMETLSIHEASPGHHFQISIAQEVEGLPMFRRFGGYNAFSEGWALYAESLGKELGLFTDPYQWYGRLADEQLRAMRLVVDTGLHAKGWTRERAIQYMKDNSSMAESDIVAEVERYIVIPGQALGYKLGEFAIRDLRNEAARELGARFDVRAFHRQVLIDGGLPLDVLRSKIRDWIATQKR
jgi:uncharacterized protein (DUF885 family)